MAKKATKGVLLINLGTPDSPKTGDVRKYLRQFLMDWRVIDIPVIARWFLINFIIAPFRAPKSAEIYNELWTKEGSPLLFIGQKLTKKVQQILGEDYLVSFGMRYQNPSLEKSLEPLKNKGLKELIFVPLYPQYASSSTGSTFEAVMEIIKDWQVIPNIRFISGFSDEPTFYDAWEDVANNYLKAEKYDHIVFSYHGLPERQITKASCEGYCQLNDKCCSTYHAKNHFCYKAQCYETTRQLASRLNLAPEDYSVCFQSRLGKTPWITPHIDDTVEEIAAAGHKKVLAFSPAFVTDCLETTIEIGVEYKELFLEKGGEKWQLVESLNTNDKWVDCLKAMITR